MQWKIYLSGEIHTDWREQIIDGAKQQKLPVSFTSAVTDHAASDAAGDLLGKPQDDFWRDHQSASINAIRTQTYIRDSDIAIIRFGSEYKQWNAAFDATTVQRLASLTSRYTMLRLFTRSKKSMLALRVGQKHRNKW